MLGLAVPLVFSLMLWFDLSAGDTMQMHGMFNTLVVDKFSLFFKFLLIAAAGVVILSSTDYVKKFERFQAEYYALVLFATTGMMLLASTTELITIYISLELTALPIAALAAFMRNSRSTESGMKFLILSAISSAILLYGMVIVYGFTGTTSLPEIAQQIGGMELSGGTPFGSNALLFGIVLMIAGFGFKIASVPFQMWAPDVYEGSPTPITAFLSVASKAAGFAVILRVFYIAFPADTLSLDWSATFAVLSALSMTIGNLVAIRQDNIKRMMGYSTIAHAGYILVGLAAVATRTPGAESSIGPSGVLFYLGGFAATNLAAFSVIIAISNRINSDRIDDYAGNGAPSAHPRDGPDSVHDLPHRHPARSRLLGKNLPLRRGSRSEPRMARGHRRGQQRSFSLLLSPRSQGNVPLRAHVRGARSVRPAHAARGRHWLYRYTHLRHIPHASPQPRPIRCRRPTVITCANRSLSLKMDIRLGWQ